MTDSSNWRIRAPVDLNAEPSRNAFASRRPRNEGRNPIMNLAEKDRPDDLKLHRPQKQADSPETHQAIMEGRRLYIGNLLYSTTVEDINTFLAENGFATVQNLHISVDPFSGRNPGYCFVEFADKATADDALRKLEGAPLSDRMVKCRPCQPKGAQREVSRYGSSSSNSNRWDDWSRQGGDNRPNMTPRNSGSGQMSKAQEEGRQLYVGGLPRMLDQAENEVEMRDIFKDFEVEGVSKRISPREPSDDNLRRNFCFVDFSTREQAQEAAAAIHGSLYRDAPLKVTEAIPRTDRYWLGNKGEKSTRTTGPF